MVDSLAVSTHVRARTSHGPGEWRIEGAGVRPAQRARAVEQIWRSVAEEPHQSAAPLLAVRFDDPDVVLMDPLGDGTWRAISKQGDFAPRHLVRLFADGHAVLPEAIEKLVQRLERSGELSDACAAIRGAMIELLGGAIPGPCARAVCAAFTPWGVSGTPVREHWEQRHENALVRLGAEPLAREVKERRRRRQEAAHRICARHGDPAAPRRETSEALLNRGVGEVRARQLSGELPAALGLCRELLRDFAHEPEPWLVLAELGTQSGASSAVRLFACHEAIAAARGRGAVVERACRVFGFHDPRALARAFRSSGSTAVADWLAAA